MRGFAKCEGKGSLLLLSQFSTGVGLLRGFLHLRRPCFSLSKKVASLKNRIEAAAIPTVYKANLKVRLSKLQDQIMASQKKVGKQNIHKAVEVATQMAEVVTLEGKAFCVTKVEVGLDASAIREAVLKVMDQKGIPVMVFSMDEASNKAVVYAGVPDKIAKDNVAVKWVKAALGPIKGKGGGKGGLAQGQGTDASGLEEAMNVARQFATMELS